MPKIVVVGAGVIGLSSAVAIQERVGGAQVTIVADSFTQDTTSDGAGGLFVPDADGVDVSLIRKWGREGARYFYDLAFSDKSGEAGVYISHGYQLSTEPLTKLPLSLEFSLACRRLSQEELSRFQPHYQDGYFFTTVIVEGRKYLPWMTSRFLQNGGRLEKRRLQSFDELGGLYDVLVNCSGLGSIQLAADSLTKPLRGQGVRVYAPWIKYFTYGSDNVFILPSAENVFIGSTKDAGEYDVRIDPAVSEQLLEKAVTRMPALKGAKKLWDWVGLRPYRNPPRVDTELRKTSQDQTLKIVHNYGHGSTGISLSWGTAVSVAEMVDSMLTSRPRL